MIYPKVPTSVPIKEEVGTMTHGNQARALLLSILNKKTPTYHKTHVTFPRVTFQKIKTRS